MSVLDKESDVTEQMELGDLSEMLGFCYLYQEMGHLKVQLNTEHATEILERLIAYEQGAQQ